MTTRILHPLFALLASVTKQELARQVAYLKEENRILRARLPDRIYTTEKERRRLVRVGKKLGTQLKELMTIVSYDSFRRWVREIEGSRSERKESGVQKRKPGRPRTPDEVKELIIKVRSETGLGYTRILGELRKLGIRVSRQTVKNILAEAGLAPDPGDGDSQDSWDAFLKRHADTLWQCDFVTKPMWTAKGLVDLYLLVFIHLGTRQSWISPCTTSPDSVWVSQQAKNFLMDSEDMELAPKMVMRDNDKKFTKQFDAVFETSGAMIKRNIPLSPNLRAHVERFIQTLKFECLDKFVIVAQRHLNYICREWNAHYNMERPHEHCGNLPPKYELPPEPICSIKTRDIVCHTRLGGLLNSYSRRAA